MSDINYQWQNDKLQLWYMVRIQVWYKKGGTLLPNAGAL